MNLLLDTHIFLWFLDDSTKLSSPARQQIASADSVFVSAASIWEAAIKAAIGRLQVSGEDLIGEIAANGFLELPVMARHAALVRTLPLHHRDPFDRLLVAQSLSEPLHLLTADAILSLYSRLVVVV